MSQPDVSIAEIADEGKTVERAPVVSVVVPCLNEKLCIGEFVDWCQEGLRKACVSGEIIIVDSSTDGSAEIAEKHGARVLRVPKRGLGRAYIDAIPHIRGKYVIMGDCDLTYDFRELKPFVEKLDGGAQFVMGSRFRGSIEPGAMPGLHRFFGTPLTTAILNGMYRTLYSDIHCGMRAITREALLRLNLESQSWEYASEMVLKAARLNLRIDEVPVHFYKDRDGRLSHHKRSGWFSPWQAGWINLRAMFLYAPEFFLLVPGWIMFVVGLISSIVLCRGPVEFAGIGFDLHFSLLAATLATLGYSALVLSVLATAIQNFQPERLKRWVSLLTYNRGVLTAATLVAGGVAINIHFVVLWIQNGLRLQSQYHPGIFGLLLIILGFQTFTFTLLLHVIHLRQQREGRG